MTHSSSKWTLTTLQSAGRRRGATHRAALLLCLALSGCDDGRTASGSDPVTVGGDESGGSGSGGSATSGTRDAATPALPDAGPAPMTSDGETCWFEYLGDWTRCEDSGFPNIVDVGAASLQECADACLEDDECNAIVDYFWLGAEGVTCSIMVGACDSPAYGDLYEIDGGKEYRKVCGSTPPADARTMFEHTNGTVVDPSSGCVFRALMPLFVCEGHGEETEIVGAETLDECFALCQEREDCSAVQNPFSVPDEHECLLHLSTCDAPAPNPSFESEDQAAYYAKICEGALDADAGTQTR